MTKEQELTKPSTVQSQNWINIWQWCGQRFRGWGTWASKEEAERMAHEYLVANKNPASPTYHGAMPESEWTE